MDVVKCTEICGIKWVDNNVIVKGTCVTGYWKGLAESECISCKQVIWFTLSDTVHLKSEVIKCYWQSTQSNNNTW